MEQAKRHYNLSDAELCLFTSILVITMTRDHAKFTVRPYNLKGNYIMNEFLKEAIAQARKSLSKGGIPIGVIAKQYSMVLTISFTSDAFN
jgi:hypothetical protein